MARFLVMTAALLVLAGAPLANAQAQSTASVRGRVVDATGAGVPDVSVAAENVSTGLRRETRTDRAGYYAFSALPLTGEYTIKAARDGFAPEEIDGLGLRAGETVTVDVRLEVAGQTSEVTVFGTTEGVRSDAPQLLTRFDKNVLDNTPILGRKLTSVALLNSALRPARGTGDLFLNNILFVSNGGGRRQTSFSIDGSTGDDNWGRQTIFTNIPLAAIQELSVLPSSFSAEYGRTTGGVVNIVTRAGTNAYEGEVFGVLRPGGLQAAAPLATRRTEDALKQVGGSLGGPLAKDRTHAYLSGEYNSQDRDAVITSTLAPGLFTGHYRQGLLLARADHRLDARNTLTARFNLERFHDTNPSDAVGGLNLPSAGRVFTRNTWAAQVAQTALVGRSAVLESRAQRQRGSPITEFEPVAPSTQFVRPGLGTEGESRFALLTNTQLEWAESLTLTRGRHALKVGADAIHSTSGGNGQEFGSGFVLGQFTLLPGTSKPISSLTLADVQRFQQAFGTSTYEIKEWLWAVFAQDSIAVSRALSLSLGLRYERQTFTDDTNNLAPRVGIVFRPGGDPKTALRAGYGIYYSELRANSAAGYSLNGPEGVFTFSVAPGQLGFPSTLGPLPAFPPGAVLPARDITVRAGQRDFVSRFVDVSRLRGYPDALVNPRTDLFTAGVERDLGGRWIASADYVHQHIRDIDRTLDLNPPAPFDRTQPGQLRSAAAADLTRPIVPQANGYRRVLVLMNEGVADYDALQLNVSRRGQRFSMLVSYTLSKSTNTVEPDAPGGQDPNDSTQLGETERAESVLSQRHRGVLSGFVRGPADVLFGAVVTVASGRPYNITTGIDNNGDGNNTDRPVLNGRVIGRNEGHGSAVYQADAFLEREFRLGGRARIAGRVEGFNIFNHGNIVGRNGVYGNDPSGTPSPTLGAPVGGIAGVDPSRSVQLSAKVRF